LKDDTGTGLSIIIRDSSALYNCLCLCLCLAYAYACEVCSSTNHSPLSSIEAWSVHNKDNCPCDDLSYSWHTIWLFCLRLWKTTHNDQHQDCLFMQVIGFSKTAPKFGGKSLQTQRMGVVNLASQSLRRDSDASNVFKRVCCNAFANIHIDQYFRLSDQ